MRQMVIIKWLWPFVKCRIFVYACYNCFVQNATFSKSGDSFHAVFAFRDLLFLHEIDLYFITQSIWGMGNIILPISRLRSSDVEKCSLTRHLCSPRTANPDTLCLLSHADGKKLSSVSHIFVDRRQLSSIIRAHFLNIVVLIAWLRNMCCCLYSLPWWRFLIRQM